MNEKQQIEKSVSMAQQAVLSQQIRDEMPVIIEGLVLRAQLMKHKYDALIDAGFNEEQSLKMCQEI